MKLEEAIRQQRFRNQREKLIVNLLYTASWIKTESGKVLKRHGLSVPLFNVLRILKGQKKTPISVLEIQQRMLDQQSNASRLIDRLVNKGLAKRVICKDDRRKMDVSITDKGLNILNQVVPLVDEEHSFLVSLTEEEQKEVNELLDKMRSKKEGEINV